MQVHLFDIDIPGGVTFKESDTLTAGKIGTVVDTDAGRLGIAICYDIRFPELAVLYAQRGCQLLVYPGERCNILLKKGPDFEAALYSATHIGRTLHPFRSWTFVCMPLCSIYNLTCSNTSVTY